MSRILVTTTVAFVTLLPGPPAAGIAANDDLDRSVEAAIERATTWLAGNLDRIETQNEGHAGGLEALVLYSLLAAGRSIQDPVVTRLEAAVVESTPKVSHLYTFVYATAALASLDDRKHRTYLEWFLTRLAEGQRAEGPGAGAWGYWLPPLPEPGIEPEPFVEDWWDNSNTQNAVFAQRVALAHGLPVDPAVFERAVDYLLRAQNRDGGFGYAPKLRPDSSLAMSAGCLAALAMAAEVLPPTSENERRRDRAQVALDKGFRKLDAQLVFPPRKSPWPFYAAYALERALCFGVPTSIDVEDVRRDLARWLVAAQSADGSYGTESALGTAGRRGGRGGVGKKSRMRANTPGQGDVPRTCFALLTLVRATERTDRASVNIHRLVTSVSPIGRDRGRIKARVACQGARALSPLIEVLESEPGPRAEFADECLREITGRDMGFARAKSEDALREAIDGWVELYLDHPEVGRRAGG